jgi:hypothetical protein
VFSKIFQALYHRVFVTIIVKRSTTVVYVELLKKKGIVNSEHRSFTTTAMNDELHDFVTSYTKESPFHYISILDKSVNQGAIPTCSKSAMSTFHNLQGCEYKCYKDKWSYYTSKEDIYALEHKYEKIGLDFIFSPFIILHNFFKDKIDSHKAMYVLIEENYMSLSVFDNSELLFAQHLDVEHYKQSDELLMEADDMQDDSLEIDETIDLDDIDTLDELDDLDDFGSIEDLDTLEDMDDFAQTHDVEEEFNQLAETKSSSSEDASGFNEDYQRFLLIQSAINNFYKDDRYQSEFIENVYIADSVKVSKDLKRYLEEEMFLSVYIRRIDLAHEVCEVTKLELQ